MKRTQQFSNALKISVCFFLAYTFCLNNIFSQSVGINYTGAAPNSSALLDIDANGVNKKGLLIPRMTLVERGSIINPAEGLIIYQTDNTPGFYYNSSIPPASAVWVSLASGGGQSLKNNLGIAGGTTLIGGTGTTDPLILRSTSGIGAVGADIIFQGGPNGATEIARMIGGGMNYSYANPGGSGNRTASISITKSSGLLVGGPGGLASLVDGNTTADVLWFNAATQNVAGHFICFDFGAGVSRVINEAKWYQSHLPAQGSWKWQGSNNGTSWTDIGAAFTLGGSLTQTITELAGNTTAYRYYQILGVSGTCNWNTNLREMEFKTGISTGTTVGIGVASPTEKLDVAGNIKFSGALMPNNTAGTNGQVLTSAGAGAPPTWTTAGASGWGLTGNSGTTDGTNFLGTTDNVGLAFKTNNTERARLLSTGELIIGETSLISQEKLSIQSSANTTCFTNLRANSNGNSAVGIYRVTNDANKVINFGMIGSGYTTNGGFTAGYGYMYTDGNGMNFINDGSGATNFYTGGYASGNLKINFNSSGRAFFGGSTSATALVHLGAGTATASTAPLKFTTQGTSFLTAPEAGAIEYGTPGFVIQNDNLIIGDKALDEGEKFSIRSSANTSLFSLIRNTSSGSSAITFHRTKNNSGKVYDYGIIGSGYTTSGAFKAGYGYMYSNASGMNLINDDTNGLIAFYTGGYADANERVRILSDGKVGIGTASPTEKLEIAGNIKFSGALMPNNAAGTNGQVLTSAGSGAPPIWTNAGASGWGLTGNAGTTVGTNFLGTTDNIGLAFKTNNTERIRITETGNLGVNTTNPFLLANYPMSIQTSEVAGNAVALVLNNPRAYDAVASAALVFTRARPGDVTASNPMGMIHSGNEGSNTSSYGFMAFSTASTSNNLTEQMRITSSGNIGIGTSTPDSKIHMLENVNATSFFHIQNPNTGTSARSYIYSSTDGGSCFFGATGQSYNGVAGWGDACIIQTSGLAGGIKFYNGGNGGPVQFSTTGGTDDPSFYLNSSGNVGIGTNSPTTNSKLHIKDGHFRAEQTTAPTVAASTQNGITAAGITTGSSDTKGNITTTGTNNGTNTVLTITFNMPYAVAPTVVVTSANANGQACTYYVTSSTTTFTLNFNGGTANPSFNYMIIE